MTDNTRQMKDEEDDKELNALLDSALQDFDKMSLSAECKNTESTSDSSKQSDKHETDKHETSETPEDNWTEDFFKQTASQFEKDLETLLQNGDSELEAALNKIRQLSTSDATDETGTTSNTDFQSTISQVLKDLTANSENLKNDADLTAMLGQASLDGGSDLLPFMQGMMEQLLSKEILYPSLKELADKYPKWLEEHIATLSSSDLENYTKQSELIQKVCVELEKETETDTDSVKKQRFEYILKLMTEMQSYGQAPEDLVGEQNSFFQFDSEGNPILPPLGENSPQDCCIM